MGPVDEDFLRVALAVAARARAGGNHPFGAVLVDGQGHMLLEAENTVVTERDCTGHAELNLMRQASKRYEPAFLATCTLYSSTEPCAMCSGALFWGHIGRVVFGLREECLLELVGSEAAQSFLLLPCRDVLCRGQRKTEVVGPLLEEEARRVHEGFWQVQI